MNFIQEFFKTYNKGLEYDALEKELDEVSEMYKTTKTSLKISEDAKTKYHNQVEILRSDVFELKSEVEDLNDYMDLVEDETLKSYLYNRYIKKKTHKWNNISVRDFCLKNNNKTPTVEGATIDDKANNALKYVAEFMKYTSDDKENWQYANETVERKLGDCEDGAILMYNIMVKSGIPVWRIRLNAGDVRGGGHCYLTYLREKDNKWFVLDWCYWYKESVNFKKTWSYAKKYFGIWFSFNEDYVWLDK